MVHKFTQNAPYGVTVIRISNGAEAIYLHGECISCGDASTQNGIGARLALTLDVPYQLHEMQELDSNVWCWNDITDSLGWGNTITLPAGCVVSELQLSTSHITREDCDILSDITGCCERPEWIHDTREGFIVRPYAVTRPLLRLKKEGLSKALRSVIYHCMKDSTVQSVHFTSDGSVLDMFETFDW